MEVSVDAAIASALSELESISPVKKALLKGKYVFILLLHGLLISLVEVSPR